MAPPQTTTATPPPEPTKWTFTDAGEAKKFLSAVSGLTDKNKAALDILLKDDAFLKDAASHDAIVRYTDTTGKASLNLNKLATYAIEHGSDETKAAGTMLATTYTDKTPSIDVTQALDPKLSQHNQWLDYIVPGLAGVAAMFLTGGNSIMSFIIGGLAMLITAATGVGSTSADWFANKTGMGAGAVKRETVAETEIPAVAKGAEVKPPARADKDKNEPDKGGAKPDSTELAAAAKTSLQIFDQPKLDKRGMTTVGQFTLNGQDYTIVALKEKEANGYTLVAADKDGKVFAYGTPVQEMISNLTGIPDPEQKAASLIEQIAPLDANQKTMQCNSGSLFRLNHIADTSLIADQSTLGSDGVGPQIRAYIGTLKSNNANGKSSMFFEDKDGNLCVATGTLSNDQKTFTITQIQAFSKDETSNSLPIPEKNGKRSIDVPVTPDGSVTPENVTANILKQYDLPEVSYLIFDLTKNDTGGPPGDVPPPIKNYLGRLPFVIASRVPPTLEWLLPNPPQPSAHVFIFEDHAGNLCVADGSLDKSKQQFTVNAIQLFPKDGQERPLPSSNTPLVLQVEPDGTIKSENTKELKDKVTKLEAQTKEASPNITPGMIVGGAEVAAVSLMPGMPIPGLPSLAAAFLIMDAIKKIPIKTAPTTTQPDRY